MNYSTAIFLINEKARAILCEYEPGEEPSSRLKGYTFKTLNPNVKVDDLVIVETGTRQGMTVVKVIETDVDIDFDSDIQYKWIVGIVNTEAHKALREQEQTAISAIKKAKISKKRKDLKTDLMADHEDSLKTLQISDINGDTPEPPVPETPYKPQTDEPF